MSINFIDFVDIFPYTIVDRTTDGNRAVLGLSRMSQVLLEGMSITHSLVLLMWPRKQRWN